MRRIVSIRYSLIGLLALSTIANSHAQVIYTWNNTGTDWGTSGNWNPSGVPNTTDSAVFSPSAGILGSSVVNPGITAGQLTANTTFAINQNYGGWTISGAGSLTSGSGSGNGLQLFGPTTVVFNGPALQGTSPAATLGLFTGYGSTLVLSGNSAITSNQGSITSAGIFQLDNTTTNIGARVLTSSNVTLLGGGTFELIGNAAGTTTNVGTLNSGSNAVGGVNVIKVTPNGALTQIIFANSAAGFTTRPGTRGIYSFVAASGNLGDAAGGQITFVGTPFLGANGLLSNTNAGSSFGYAIATDAGGTDFATWTASAGVIRAVPTQIGTTAANLQSYTAADRVQFNPSTNQNATAAITNGSLRISPTTSGLSLALGTNNLNTVALMLDGSSDYTISGTGLLNGGATRYVYVNNPNNTLTTSMVIASAGNPTVIAGPGLVSLNGVASQNTLTTTTRLVLNGGVLRGNNTQIGFTGTGLGIISFSGGVLEIANGNNGTGASADFTRALGAAASNVTWGATTTNESGSGGFSAFGSNASINLGGAATPSTVQWASSNFVPNGYALTFGSSRSNAVLNWLNPIQLDNGTNYALREVKVTAGTGGDRTVLAGAITGAANADLIKTGSGILDLTASNTYNGNTFVQGGTLRINGTNVPSTVTTGTSLSVNSGATLGGAGTLGSATNPVNTFVNGTLAPGNSAGRLTINGNVTFTSTSTFTAEINAATTAGTDYDQLRVGSAGSLSLGNATLNATLGYSPAFTDRIFLTDNLFAGSITGIFSGLTEGGTVNLGGYTATISYLGDFSTLSILGGNDVVLYNFIASVPEPGTIVLLGLTGFFGLQWYLRRKGKEEKTPASEVEPQTAEATPTETVLV